MNNIDWIFQGVRETPVFEACLKLIAWGPELKHRIGVGHEHFVITNKGEYYMSDAELLNITTAIYALPNDLTYIHETKTCKEQMMKELSTQPINEQQIIKGLIQQLSAFYIARIKTDQLFVDSQTVEEVKQEIIAWRNDPLLFEAHDAFLHILSHRFAITESVIDMLTIQELNDLLENKFIEWKTIRERQNGEWTVSLENGLIVFAKSNKAPIVISEDHDQVLSGTSIVKGVGIITGIVGENILVTEMTRPEMLNEMKKYRAIITNQGSLLSHAAITCRELNIPCIIGTKNATEILKDGDTIEIDTDTGIIRKL